MFEHFRESRVEAAFRKFDKNEDGFLDWAEFQQVHKLSLKIFHQIFQASSTVDVTTLRRIFETLDEVREGLQQALSKFWHKQN